MAWTGEISQESSGILGIFWVLGKSVKILRKHFPQVGGCKREGEEEPGVEGCVGGEREEDARGGDRCIPDTILNFFPFISRKILISSVSQVKNARKRQVEEEREEEARKIQRKER